ncbi:hypothetical protein [Catelliglobosispora koreensis]|uniref:hypothetical protein n=1 Tax=Catelliglobosispora koreensis TaxID=129052 RepID=UPI0003724254|nr:hypothetical protein [Catelliglobosispora koreensis]
MTTPKLRLVASNETPQQVCNCRPWGLLHHVSRDLVLADFMEWAQLFHQVQLKMLVRGDHVAICELLARRPGQGRARLVMSVLCAWADCARVTLELTPSDHWGSDVERLTKFYESLEFEPNLEQEQRFRVQESMIRYPVRGRVHVRR